MFIKLDEKIIVVVGLFATGKTTVTNEITKMNPDIKIYKTDDFIQYSQPLQPRFIMNRIMLDKPERYLIEGVTGYRLLRNGIKENNFYPDVVIHCVCTDGTRQDRYLKPDRWYAGRHSKATKIGLKDFKAFDNMYRKMWEEYLASPKKREPRIITHVTELINPN